jgi:predicted dehydrogenase
MISIAVLGAGGHSSANHGPAFKYIKSEDPEAVELAAVCDLNAEKAAAYADKFGFERTYQDVGAMLDAENIDGLVLITPVELTEQIASELLPVGIPLVIEKPPGVDSDAARRLADLADETGTPHMVSMNRRFSPVLVRTRQWLAKEAADRPPQVCIARMLRHNRTEETFRTWTGIHVVDAALSVMGRPDHVHATNIPTEHDDVFLAQAQVDTDIGAVHYFMSSVVGNVEETYEFHGPDYNIQADTWNCTLKIFDANEQVVDWAVDDDRPRAYVNGTVAEMRAFIDAIAGKRDFGPTLHDAHRSVLTAEAIAAGGDSDIEG